MARERKPADNSSLLPKVRSVTLNEDHPKLKIALVVGFIAVALICFCYALVTLLRGNTGWNTLDTASSGIDCSSEIQLEYNFSDLMPADRKQLSVLYTEASQKAYIAFNTSQHYNYCASLYDVNTSAGKEVTVEPCLYNALKTVLENGNRLIYLGPVYGAYDNLFYSEDDAIAKQFSPETDADTAEFIAKTVSFSSSDEHISIELLGNNIVRLNVSAEYAKFAEEHGFNCFVDFGWLKNAFIIDYFADLFTENGYTSACFVSVDGFSRRLDNSGETFAVNLFHKEGETIALQSKLEYDKAMSTVSLRAYPLKTGSPDDRYYEWSDGTVTTEYIDGTDGRSKAGIPELTATSETVTCGELALKIAPLFICESFNPDALSDVDSVDFVWWSNGKFISTDTSAVIK